MQKASCLPHLHRRLHSKQSIHLLAQSRTLCARCHDRQLARHPGMDMWQNQLLAAKPREPQGNEEQHTWY